MVLRVGLRRLLGRGSVVPFDFCSWCSHFWYCDCDTCWSWWSACSHCCAWSLQRQVDFLSSGGQCRLSSGGFDWRDVSQVAVPFVCGFFSSAGKFYRSSSGFRGSGPGFSSAHFWSLLHWRRLSVVLPASTVDCCLSSLRAGVCSLLWQWRFSARVLIVACLPLLRVGGTALSPVP